MMGMGVRVNARSGFAGPFDMHIKLDTFDVCFGRAGHVQMETFQPKLAQLGLKTIRRHAEIDHRTVEHIPADAAEYIEVKDFHLGSADGTTGTCFVLNRFS